MKINLLPVELQRSSTVNLRLILTIATTVTLVLAVGLHLWTLYQGVLVLEQDLAELQQEYLTLHPIEAKVQQLEQSRLQLESSLSDRGFLLQKLPYSQLLTELAMILPRDITIQELVVSESGGVEIRGRGPSYGSIAFLLSQLAQSNYLTRPDLGSIGTLSDGQGYHFQITCVLREEVVGP